MYLYTLLYDFIIEEMWLWVVSVKQRLEEYVCPWAMSISKSRVSHTWSHCCYSSPLRFTDHTAQGHRIIFIISLPDQHTWVKHLQKHVNVWMFCWPYILACCCHLCCTLLIVISAGHSHGSSCWVWCGDVNLFTWSVSVEQSHSEHHHGHHYTHHCDGGSGPGSGQAQGGGGWETTAEQAQAGDVQDQEVSWEVWRPSLLPLLERTLEQVRGLGLVQCQELLSREMHGPGVIWRSRGVQTLCQDDALWLELNINSHL